MSDPFFTEWLADYRQRAKATLDKIHWAQTRLAELHPDAFTIMRELEDAYSDQIGQHETYLWQMVRRHFPPEFSGLIDALDHHVGDNWLVFRKGGNRYPDFIKLYARQESRRFLQIEAEKAQKNAHQKPPKHCAKCKTLIVGGRADRRTCSSPCRQWLYDAKMREAGAA